MMTSDLIVALVAFAAVSLVTPGPNNFMLLASGMNFGWVRSLPHMTGVIVGFPFMVVLVGLGVVQVFTYIPHGFTGLRIISVAYLFYLAWKIATARQPDPKNVVEEANPLSFIQAAAFQWVNPKGWAMALTAITVYTPSQQPLGSVVIVALVFTIIGSITAISWTMLGQQLRYFLRTPLAFRCFNITCALLLIGSLYPLFANELQ